MSKLFVRERVPATYNRGVVAEIVRLMEEFVNALPQHSEGTCTCDADSSTTVADTSVETGSTILLMPTNAAAATLMAGATSLYVSARTSGVSFAVTTANAGAAAGTETFQYIVVN